MKKEVPVKVAARRSIKKLLKAYKQDAKARKGKRPYPKERNQ